MTDGSTITIMGCGVAGSWIAQHLCMLGFSDFVLYGDYPMSDTVLNKGPFFTQAKREVTSAAALADHIRRLNPDSTVEVHEFFKADENVDRMRGYVVGELSSMALCSSAFRAAKERGLNWISLGLPSSAHGSAKIVTDPSQIDPIEHLGKPFQPREDIMVETAKIAALIAAG